MTNENKVYVQRTFECSADSLFDWITMPELIVQWFGPPGFTAIKVDADLTVGGQYIIELAKDETSAFKVRGEYIEIRKPHSLKFTYQYENISSSPPPSKISFSLKELGVDKTELLLIQEFSSAVPNLSGRTNAWSLMFNRLSNLAR